jgi:hypothetical protein
MFSFEYSTELFRKKTIELFVKGFKEIVFSILEHKNIKLKDIKVATVFSDTDPGGIQEELIGMEF